MPSYVKSVAVFTMAALVTALVSPVLAQVRVGDEVVVRVDSAPIRNGRSVIGHVARDTKFGVLGVDRSWLWVRSQGRDVWIHQNHVTLPDAPQNIGKEPVPIASLMSSPILTPNNPFLLMRLDTVAGSLVASGREQELIEIEDDMLLTLQRIQGWIATMQTTTLLGVLGGMHINRGDQRAGTDYLNQAFRSAQQTLRDLESGRLREPNGMGTLQWTSIHMMAASGWPQANSGDLIEGERKLAAAAAALDRLLPLEKLLDDDEFTSVVDSRIYTWHADVLLRLNRVGEARTQMVKADRCAQAYIRWSTHPMTFGRPNSSGYGGYPEALKAQCMVHGGELPQALQQMHQSQRQQHQSAMWSGHIDEPTLELVLREKRGSSAMDNFLHDPFDWAMALAQYLDASPELAKLSAEWTLNRKFKLQETVQRQTAIVRDNEGLGMSKMPDSAWMTSATSLGEYASNERIRSIRGLAADYALRSFSPLELDEARREFETVRYLGAALRSTRLRDLAVVPAEVRKQHRLSVSPSYNSETKKVDSGDPLALLKWHDEEARSTWVDIQQIQQHLDNDQVLIEFARYNDFDYALLGETYRWLPPRYAAWIVPANGEASRIDLGAADVIESAIRAIRSGIQAGAGAEGTISTLGEPEAVSALAPAMNNFAKLVVDPIRPLIKDAVELVISPDADLWLVPWAALPWTEQEYLIERFQMRTVTTGRELTRDNALATNEDSLQPTAPVIVADPDFDLANDLVLAAEQALLGDESGGMPIIIAKRGKSVITAADPLPYTKIEAELIAPAIETCTGIEPKLYLQADAHEAIFSRIERPRLLVLSTHAFFLADNAEESRNRSRLDIRDPLMRCGLLLAGSSHHDDWALRRSNDGVLTGYEVSSLDLRSTELVVLSACDTGVGDVRSAEGLMGLRQAFHTAGARSVVASLWKVPDRETALQMSTFFEELGAGRGKAEALRNAQLARIAARRAKSGAAHPYTWAAFAMTGD